MTPDELQERCDDIIRMYHIDFESAHEAEDELMYDFAKYMAEEIDKMDKVDVATIREVQASIQKCMKILETFTNTDRDKYFA